MITLMLIALIIVAYVKCRPSPPHHVQAASPQPPPGVYYLNADKVWCTRSFSYGPQAIRPIGMGF